MGGTVKRRVEVIVETERTIEVGSRVVASGNWCEGCGSHTTMLTLEMAAAMACLGSGAIYHWIENAEFHFQRTRAGLVRICPRSFLDHLRRMNYMPKPKGGISGEAKKKRRLGCLSE